MVKRIQETVKQEPGLSRKALSLRVCEWLGWRDALGRAKQMSCRTALMKLHRQGHIQLPVGNPAVPRRVAPAKCPKVVESLKEIDCSFEQLGDVELIRVSRWSSKSDIWNALMDRYHYLGAGPLCGAQMRYLIHSKEQGYLGGLSFSAAAWSVQCRDQWIGWSPQARRSHLQKVIGNSRFLILPQVRVKNLASHVLSLSVQRVVKDWVERYGYEPVLMETFVEQARFEGTCYRAANWVELGATEGRGRQDRKHQSMKPIKRVLVYPLRADAREILCQQEGGTPIQEEASGELEKSGEDHWVEQEFGTVPLLDERLKKRLWVIAEDLYNHPQANIPQACQTKAKTKAAYRFFDHEECKMDRLLKSHYESTLRRIQGEKIVLAVQDTTSLNYSAHPATEGMGLIGSKPDGVIGLILHDTAAFSEQGTPLGLMDIQLWAREAEDFGKKQSRHELPIEEKESYKWLKSYKKVSEFQKQSPKTQLVIVGDREADIYELFELKGASSGGPELLVRANHNRSLAGDPERLWEKLSAEPVAGIQTVRVPRRSKQAARTAELEVRFARLKLRPPKSKAGDPELEVQAVFVREINVPKGVEALEWMLLTTVEVGNFEQAIRIVKWYMKRWGIEVYHKTLKSGCRVEERQLGNADRIEACLSIDLVVAWRIHRLAYLGRATPDVPCTVYFEEAEWKALCCYLKQDPRPPENPPTLREATHMVANLGGFLGRKSDGEPGTQSLWLGLQRLDDITSMWVVMAPHSHPNPVAPAFLPPFPLVSSP